MHGEKEWNKLSNALTQTFYYTEVIWKDGYALYTTQNYLKKLNISMYE